MKSLIIRIECADAIGLVFKITEIFFRAKLNIIENGEYVDELNKRFFMRSVVSGQVPDNEALKRDLLQVLPQGARVDISTNDTKKIVVFATKEHHCLGDLLLRNLYKQSNFEIQAVIANHADLGDLVRKFNLTFHYLPTEGKTRQTHESKIGTLLAKYNYDYLVLAKYMRILSPEFVAQFAYKIINIHHSFLPAFIGAKPYNQAFERGVKIIGATAHFVTDDLDQGPIIYQDVMNVSHHYTAKELAKAGKEVETAVLARALELVFEERVMINGNKTIIF
ncbi:MAG: formyltetrahydrofolate deformylase [Chitinophagales bacterium]|nr:formyltetrahydrofolate deformylase [Bacteroidota bacterium]MCB9042532.1 formyltetrahydrofolate deformylase [Chitinophagales bacterium]